VGFVYRPKIGGKRVKIIEGSGKGVLDKIPMLFVESRSETVWARARVVIHGEKSRSNIR
jgi:hypothetical protein